MPINYGQTQKDGCALQMDWFYEVMQSQGAILTHSLL